MTRRPEEQYTKDFPSPNAEIDRALKNLMRGIKDQPADVQVKILAQAIVWERVKHSIADDDEEFDPDV